MNLTKSINRNSVFFLCALVPFAVWAFWTTYWSKPSAELLTTEHLHGISMFGWCFLLVFQALLIRVGRRDIHRLSGRFSYLLVPLIAVSTVLLAQDKLNIRGLESTGPFLLGLQLFLLLQFLLIYGLAIANRREADVHARYMIGTVFPMIDPIFNRILAIHLAEFLPVLGDLALLITLVATDLLIVVLLLADRRSGYRKPVFRNTLVVVVATQVPIIALALFPAWKEIWFEFARWYSMLPI